MSVDIHAHAVEQLDAEIGERVLILMFRQKVTQLAMARALGMNQAGIARRLRGGTAWKSTDLKATAELLQTTIAYLVGETDEPEPWARWGSNPRPADYTGVGSTSNRITFAHFPERTAA